MLYFLARLIGLLPWRVLYALGDALAAYWRWNDARPARAALRGLELAFPQMPDEERRQLQRAALRHAGRQTFETLRLWTQPPRQNLARLREGPGVALFDAALAEGRGVIVAAPHHGNWELLNQWLAARTPLAILYAPPDSALVEAFLRRVRAAQDGAGRIEQVRAEGLAIRALLKRLNAGGVVGILPDQQPKRGGDGVFAPFFGWPALTITLVGRLAQRTGARVLYAWCEREGDGADFTVHVEEAPEAIAERDAVVSASALNAGIEAIVRRRPEQYQWTYKRWTKQPPDSPTGNPYWPDCY